MTDAKAKLAQITTPPATPEEVATTRPIVQKLAAQSKYSNIRITVKARDVVGPLWAAVSIQFLVGLLASLITGVPLSFWLTGLALTNFAGTAAPRWRAAARCAIPLAISAGGLFLTRNAPLARPVVPTLLVIGFAVTIWNYRRGPFERLLGLWVSPR